MSSPQSPLNIANCASVAELSAHMEACRECPRLVAWRETIAQVKVKRFAEHEYWGKAVPGFGDPKARLLVIGLAPAAHGGNRTGRVFTGDRSGDWLYRALHKAGFASQAESTHRDDGLILRDCYISAVAHCAPPENKLTREEIQNCHPYLVRELALLSEIKVVIALGKIAWDAMLRESIFQPAKGEKKPTFGHLSIYHPPAGPTLIGSYHPSQQNTFTGKLTEPMFDAVFAAAGDAIVQAEKTGPWETLFS